MSIAALVHVLKVCDGDTLTPGETGDLEKEVLLMTLARATKADTRILPVEVSTVQRVMREVTGEDLSEADIRVAASSALFESISLESALASISRCLTPKNRAFVARSLAEVIRSDDRVSELELDFFDSVAKALGMRPSEIAGLVAS